MSFAPHRLLRSGGGADGREAGYASGRTIDTDRRETVPPADPYAVRIVRDSLDGSEGLQALKNDVLAAEAASGKTWIVYLMHEFYSPIDEEIDDFLTWLGPVQHRARW